MCIVYICVIFMCVVYCMFVVCICVLFVCYVYVSQYYFKIIKFHHQNADPLMDGQDRFYGARHPSIARCHVYEGFPVFGVPCRFETMVESPRLEREIRSRSLAPGDVPRVLVAAEAGKTWILDFLHRPHVQDGEMGGFAPQTRDLSALSSWAIFRRKFLPR